MGENAGGAITSAINTTKEEDKPQALLSRAETLCFCEALSNGTAAGCEHERVFVSPGGERESWHKKIKTGGALELCLAVIKGRE